jgi:hypothetical protein
MQLKPFETKTLPPSPPLRKLIGPSFILLGMGLGSGEIIMWPYITSNWGLGVIWGVLVGITLQFFMNMEIERYALVRGESVFMGFARKSKYLPFWFLLSTFIPWIWPGLIASSATFLGTVFGITNVQLLAIIFLIIIGLILSLGPVLYKTVERIQKTVILIGIPFIFVLAIIVIKNTHWIEMVRGFVGIGNGYFLLPKDISIASFLAALTYAGAGGNLNLAQSCYIREKGYGMGVYTGKIGSLLTGKKSEAASLLGSKFDVTPESLSIFKRWWRNINLEHFSLFWLTGMATILVLAVLAYSTTFGLPNKPEGVLFVVTEGMQIGKAIAPVVGMVFLVVLGIMLFATQLTVLDATARINSENIALISNGKIPERKIPVVYYTVLWLQIIAGILIYLFAVKEPLQLVIISSILNAFAMFIHVALTLWMNLTSLEKPLRPNLIRSMVMMTAFVFYGGFSIFVLIDKLF